MPMPLKDLSGQKFGRLTVIERHGTSSNPVMWKCECDCGTEKPVAYKHLKYGGTISCGCYRDEYNKRPRSHGQSCKAGNHRTKTYTTWEGIKQRCHNPNYHQYANYGGRGIKVCERWRNSFEAFFEDMGEKPKGLTLERIDNDKGYSKENCRWATSKEQARNRRDNRFITYNGETKIMTDWARQYGLSRGVLWHRLYNMKWDLKDALERPAMKKPRRK
jgi:hypothetical protein